MSIPQPTPPPPEDLDSRVDALLKDIHQTTDHRIAPEGTPEGGTSTTGSSPKKSGVQEAPLGGAVSAGPAEDVRDLDDQIATLLRSAEDGKSGHGPTATAGPSAENADKEKDIGALDADLARLSDSILKNNAPLPEIGPEPAPSQMGQTDKQGPGRAEDAPSAFGDDELLSAPAVKHSPARTEGPVPGRPGSQAPSSAGPESAPLKQRLVGSLGPGVVKVGTSVGRAAAPVVLTAMAAASAPLAGRPKVVRDTVGWLALWTAFVSVSLWTYLLFFHKPEVPKTEGAPIEFVGQTGKAKPEQAVASAPTEEHAQTEGTHGVAPAKGEH